MRRHLLFYLVTTSLIFSACDSPTRSSKTQIFAPEDSDFAEAIELDIVGHIGELLFRDKSSCSGFLVNDRTFVTAAHCIQKSQVIGDYTIRLLKNSAQKMSDALRVQSMSAFPNRRSQNATALYPYGDVAILRLVESYPEYKPVPILTDTRNLVPGTEVVIAGFGQTRSPKKGLQFGQTTLLQYHPYGRFQSQLLLDGGSDHTASCYGDSGGPAYVKHQGVWHVVATTHGINSLAYPELNPGEPCASGRSIYIALAEALPWLQQEGVVDAALVPIKPAPQLQTITDLESYCESETLTPEDTLTLHTLMNQVGALTCRELKDQAQSVKKLNLQGKGLTSSTALRYFTGVNILNLAGNSRIDAQDIVGMAGLEYLDLKGSGIQHVEAISELKSLQRLNLQAIHTDDSQQDLSRSLRGLVELRELDAADSGLDDLHFLAAPKLQILNLAGNDISGVTFLKQLPQLQELYLSRNSIDDLEGIQGLQKLRILTLSDNALTDIKQLTDLNSLEFVSLNHNPLSADQKICPIQEEYPGAICSFN